MGIPAAQFPEEPAVLPLSFFFLFSFFTIVFFFHFLRLTARFGSTIRE